MKTAFITGITGQDGSYLADFLVEKGYRVGGLVRPSSSGSSQRIAHLFGRIELFSGDLTDLGGLIRILESLQPDEVYNLAAQSFVPLSWEQTLLSSQVTGLGVAAILEAMRLACPGARFYQASSSEMFGNAPESPQSERTPFTPRSPYAAAKLFGHWITVNYRENFGLFSVSGICFNHESPRRGLEFVSRKVTRAAARIQLGLEAKLPLGNLEARRDWGFAGDYVQAMWRMLQQPAPEDFVIATGVSHSVSDLVSIAFERAGLDWRKHVVIDPAFQRPAEVHHLVGDASKAREKLGWKPAMDFQQLIHGMVDHDLELAREELQGARKP
ncbi:MAG: GDP-mannose 4,6-dehydratase [Planctomycetes bacterium]|nr:GDP-mannose 4,6-dehydratase [Planctomycetota bacterium]